jgi:hypothetical protein
MSKDTMTTTETVSRFITTLVESKAFPFLESYVIVNNTLYRKEDSTNFGVNLDDVRDFRIHTDLDHRPIIVLEMLEATIEISEDGQMIEMKTDFDESDSMENDDECSNLLEDMEDDEEYSQYESSIITTEDPKDFHKLVKRVKQLGQEYYKDYGDYPCYVEYIGTFKKNLALRNFLSRFLKWDWLSLKPQKGKQFLCISGNWRVQVDECVFLNDGWGDFELDFTPIMISVDDMPEAFTYKGKPVEHDCYENSIVRLERFSFDN